MSEGEKHNSVANPGMAGEEEFRTGDFAAAVKHLSEATRTKHSLSHAIMLSVALSKLKKHSDAITVLQDAYQRLPTSESADKDKVDLLRRIGGLHKSMGKLELALQHLQSAKDKGAGVLSDKEMQQLEDEIGDLKWDINRKETPNKSAEYAAQGKAMEQQKMYKEAVSLYTKSLEEEPKATVLFQRGRCFHYLGDQQAAAQDLQKALATKQGIPGVDKSGLYPILYYLGKTFLEMGDYEKSVACLTEGAEYSNKPHCAEDHELLIGALSVAKERLKESNDIRSTHHCAETRSVEEISSEKTFAQDVLSRLEKYQGDGRVWHIVDAGWIQSWSGYLGLVTPFGGLKSLEGPPRYPGPVYNSGLLENEPILLDPDPVEGGGYTNRPLKPALKEGVDFVAVPDELWVRLEKTYGGRDIKRFSHWVPEKGTFEAETFLQKISLLARPVEKWMSGGGSGVFFISKTASVKDMKEKVGRIFDSQAREKGFPRGIENHKIRVWKIDQVSVEILDKMIKRVKNDPGTVIEIDGKVLDDSMRVGEVGFDPTNGNVLVEVVPRTGGYIFREPKIIRPRMSEGDMKATEEELKKYLQAENLVFTHIPLKSILPANANKGRAGIENTGNTCYMNSGLQCISHCTELTKYFLLGLYKSEINTSNPLGQKGEFATTYASTIEDLWISSGNAPISAIELKKRIVQKAGHFRGSTQQDSQELMLHILDGLHEDLNRVKTKPYIPEKDYNGRDDQILSKEQWEGYLARNRSVIVDLFAGQFKSRIQCPKCGDVSVRFEPFMALSVPIPQIVVLKVIFVHEDVTKGAVSTELTVSESSSLEMVGDRIKQALNLPASSGIAFFAVGGEELRYVDPTKGWNVGMFKDGVYAYEYGAAGEILNPGGTCFMQVTVRYTTKGFFSNTVKQLSHPILVPVSKSDTILGLRRAIFARLRPLFNFSVTDQRKPVEVQYAKMFSESGASERGKPYVIEIVNNRKKISKYYLLTTTQYAPCEFCAGDPHSGDCTLDFKNEDKVRISDLIGWAKDGREIKLAVSITDSAPHINHKRVAEFFEKAATLRKLHAATSRFKITLYDCLELFSKEEQLDENNMWYCPHCNQNVQAMKKMSLYRLPRILIIQLKRFKQRHNPLWTSSGKVTEFVEYPTNGLDMSKFVVPSPNVAPEEEEKVDKETVMHKNEYDLFGVSSHYGDLSGGHYVASCYNPVFDKWLRFNDETVDRAMEEDIISNLAYVLFYHRVGS